MTGRRPATRGPLIGISAAVEQARWASWDMVVTLAPGNYTAQVTGVNNTTGVALIEVYELP